MPPRKVVVLPRLCEPCPRLSMAPRVAVAQPARFRQVHLKVRAPGRAGYELRRPDADLLRDGIYELRIRDGSVNYRLLYFFHGRDATILAHALTKEDRVPPADIERALRRKKAIESVPVAHTGSEVVDEP